MTPSDTAREFLRSRTASGAWPHRVNEALANMIEAGQVAWNPEDDTVTLTELGTLAAQQQPTT